MHTHAHPVSAQVPELEASKLHGVSKAKEAGTSEALIIDVVSGVALLIAIVLVLETHGNAGAYCSLVMVGEDRWCHGML